MAHISCEEYNAQNSHVFFHDLFGKLEIHSEDVKLECINSGFRCFYSIENYVGTSF